jgi:hypothetical protein
LDRTNVNHELLKLADTSTSALDADTPRETLLMAMEFVAALKEATRLLSERVESKAIEWIGQNGEIEVGEVRYYVAPNRTTKCKDLGRTLEAMLKATGGDFAETVRCLSTGAFKPGACRELLPEDEFVDLFETVETPDLKEGKPKKRLQKVNERFLK